MKKFTVILFALPAFLMAVMPVGLIQTSLKASTRSYVPMQTMEVCNCDLPAPNTFNAERTSSSTASLDWSSVSGAASYRLMVYDQSTQTLIFNHIEYGTSKSLSGLVSGATYQCVLAPMCSGAETSNFIIVEDILD